MTPCIEWTKYRDRDGYGRATVNGRHGRKAHRAAYEARFGAIPSGLDIDHLCRNRGCVNPEHMEPVTRAENTRRGISFSVTNALKTSCAHGHPYDAENTYQRSDGRRGCRTCNRAAVEKYQRRLAA